MNYSHSMYALSIAFTSLSLSAMELPNTDTQWADTPAKNAMARFSQEKCVLFDGKEYSATAIQHAYLELLRKTCGKDSQIMWNDKGENNAGIRRFKLMHYMTKRNNLQILLGFGSDSNLLLYGKNFQQQIWPIDDTNMLRFMQNMDVDIPAINNGPVTQKTFLNYALFRNLGMKHLIGVALLMAAGCGLEFGLDYATEIGAQALKNAKDIEALQSSITEIGKQALRSATDIETVRLLLGFRGRR